MQHLSRLSQDPPQNAAVLEAVDRRNHVRLQGLALVLDVDQQSGDARRTGRIDHRAEDAAQVFALNVLVAGGA